MSISTIRRQMKNVAFNFSDAQKKVREATSNDPWGPATTLMSEIADLTHNPVSFIEIMSMIWKRLNDSGKNWRHVYKSLLLLEFVLKCGHEKVAQQCRENVFTIETLKDFQYFEGDRDEGMHIRKLSETITRLLADREHLKTERVRFMLTRERYKRKNSKSVGAANRRRKRSQGLTPEVEEAHRVAMEASEDEDMQFEIALAISREESEKADELKKSDDVRLQMALEQSQKESPTAKQAPVSALDDLLSLGVDAPCSSATVLSDPWSSVSDPWPAQQATVPVASEAWDPFGINTPVTAATSNPFDPFGNNVLTPTLSLTTTGSASSTTANSNNNNNNNSKSHKNAENFLGEHKHLVNLDMLLN